LINVNSALGITFHNNQVQCPNCRKTAAGIDGTFDFVKNTIAVRSAPPRTIAILEILQSALHEANHGKPDAEVIAKIEKASPELATAIKAKISRARKPALAALLMALLVSSCSMATNATLDWNKLVDQVHVYATGATPYPTTQSSSADNTRVTRQQRRHQERQEKKKQRAPQKRMEGHQPNKPKR
jgi:hypothetical protein